MKVSFPVFIASLVAAALPSAHAEPPYQGVFTMSNNELNEIGVNRIKDDGGLEWVGAFETGGIGLGVPTGGVGRWTSANIISYHVWNNQQWLLAANMGGTTYQSSVSIFKVAADLTLERTDVVDAIRSDTSVAWATSVAAYDDRACVFGGGGGLLLECFRISTEGKLSSDFYKDFDVNIIPAFTIFGQAGPSTILFSPDGKKLALLHKGSLSSTFYDGTGQEFFPDILAQAGLYIFPVVESDVRYGEPTKMEINAYLRPSDLIWSPDSELLWTSGVPETLLGPANIMAVQVESDFSVSEIGFFEFGPSNACWIEYLNGHLYTSNWILSNDITTFPLAADRMTVDVASLKSTPLPGPPDDDGNPTRSGPLDISIAGATLSGKRYMYGQLALSAQIAAVEIAEDGSVTELGRYLYGESVDDVAWPQNAGIATTLLSQVELDELFKEPEPLTPSPTPISTPSSPPSGVSGTSKTISAFTFAFAAVVVPFIFI